MIKKNSTIIFGLLALGMVIILASAASAEFWSCFSKGQKINFCNPTIQDRTCSSTSCKYCMSRFNSTNSCYSTGNWLKCLGLTGQQAQCQSSTGGIDAQPPSLTITSPLNNALLIGRSIPFILSTSEKSEILMLDNINGRGQWSRVCSGCTSVNQKRSFAEGFNNFTIKAKDIMGNAVYQNLFFFVDSKKPQITKTLPVNKAFASGTFDVQFIEANPVTLMLHYGNSAAGMKEKTLDITNECLLSKGKYTCSTDVPISGFDGQQIGYQFHLIDKAGNEVMSKQLNLSVDTTFPKIDSFVAVPNKKVIALDIMIEEQNFADVSYMDNSVSRPRWTKICSRLINGVCEAKIFLSTGNHDLTVQINDKAGNSVGQELLYSCSSTSCIES